MTGKLTQLVDAGKEIVMDIAHKIELDIITNPWWAVAIAGGLGLFVGLGIGGSF